MEQIGVIYLCRYAEGESPVRAFATGYRALAAGVDHDLYVIFKGFPSKESMAAVRAMFGELPVRAIELDDKDYDVGSYFAAAQFACNPRLVFFNTFSELLANGWLKKFDDALNSPGVGLVGATGSWQSHRSLYELGLRRALGSVTHPREYLNRLRTDPLVTSRAASLTASRARKVFWANISRVFRRLFSSLYRLVRFDQYLLQYPPFPNPHIRTNAFMIERDRFLALNKSSFRTKFSVYKFESGWRSLTQRIILHKLRPVVVGRDGKVYDVADWKSSATFWVGSQNNLLVADNRTRDYSEGSEATRIFLERSAWTDPSSWPRGWPLVTLT